ncbi:MAG: YebC/PmpR family DNA-binding transcriptional regulator [Bacteroidia bacterium]|nr:YebC/PmpR family DNA-binding transcriptional regulator [Bacteroidia bacterium]
MSGHNKWSTIKRKKGALDSKRSKIFSKIIKEISVAVRESGADPDSNPKLRLCLQNAKGVNMPKETIQRAITKASDEGSNLHELTFEGYAPGGIGIFIECLSDNNNRSVSSIRATFSKRSGTLGTNGSLSFLFDRMGVFNILKEHMKNIDKDMFELEIIDAGAEDLEEYEDRFVITTAMENFGSVNKKLEELKIDVENAELRRIPNDYKTLDVESAKKVLRLIEEFEENEDVQNVYHNLSITDELMAAMEEE